MPLNIAARACQGSVRGRFREILSNFPVVLHYFRSIGFRFNGFRSNGMNPSTHTDNRIMIDPSFDSASFHVDVKGSIIKIGCKMKPGYRVETVSK